MSIVKAKKDGHLFPKSLSDFLNTDVFTRSSLNDLERSLSRMGRITDMPPVNITENSKDFQIELAAPGLEKNDFKIETDNNTLSISAEKKKEKKEEEGNYRRQEYSFESFCRSFELPENSMPEKIGAKYEGGILKLTLPKKEATVTTPKKEIKVS